ncbi:hypothetical protein GCM10010349_44990 [Streptomyces flavofungini]|nr:hypothetical protein GCM10010349_44990 [Streptomyces flavofungini]
MSGALEGGRGGGRREGESGGRTGRMAAERALLGLAVRCHGGSTSFLVAGPAPVPPNLAPLRCRSGGARTGERDAVGLSRRRWPTAVPGRGGGGESVTWQRTLNLTVTGS